MVVNISKDFYTEKFLLLVGGRGEEGGGWRGGRGVEGFIKADCTQKSFKQVVNTQKSFSLVLVIFIIVTMQFHIRSTKPDVTPLDLQGHSKTCINVRLHSNDTTNLQRVSTNMSFFSKGVY